MMQLFLTTVDFLSSSEQSGPEAYHCEPDSSGAAATADSLKVNLIVM